jgi:hypothetical protein
VCCAARRTAVLYYETTSTKPGGDTLIAQQLTASILALALVSLGAAVGGLYARPRESARAFWFMCGMWGVLDGAIVWPSLIQEPVPVSELRGLLGINLLLQLVYLPLGVVMATRPRPLLKGFGWGILVQAVALGAIDATFYLKCGSE